MRWIDIKAARAAWSIAAVLLALWLLYSLRKPIIIFALSVMFAYLLSPTVAFFKSRMRLRSNAHAVALLYALGLLAGCAAAIALHEPIRREAAHLYAQAQRPEFSAEVADWKVLGIPVGRQIAGNGHFDSIRERLESRLPTLQNGVVEISGDLGLLLLVPVVAFVLLIDGKKISDSILNLIFHSDDSDTISDREIVVMGVLTSAHILISEYMRALLLLCLAVFAAYAAAFSILRVPYALLLALVALPLEFIPLAGPITAGLIILGVCLFNQYPHTWVIAVFLLAYRMVQDYVLSPALMKRTVQLHPLIVIFGIFAGGEIGGIPGIFLSIPTLALARLVFYEYRKYNVALRRAVAPLTPKQGS